MKRDYCSKCNNTKWRAKKLEQSTTPRGPKSRTKNRQKRQESPIKQVYWRQEIHINLRTRTPIRIG